jgi:hypothetical protein
MKCHVLSSGQEIKYSDLVILKPVSFSRTSRRYPLRIQKENDTISGIVLLTDDTGINFGSYSYSNFTGAKYLDVVYRRDTWEYHSITFINSSFQRIIKLSKLVPRNYRFVSNVKTGDRIVLKLANNFRTFDCCNNLQNSNDIKRGIVYRLAVQPTSIWVSNITRQFGVEWNLIQMRECGIDTSNSLFPAVPGMPPLAPPPPPPPPLPNMLGISNSGNVTYRNHPDYQKFFKMLSVGIPSQAVKNKMTLLGVDPNILDTPDTIVKSQASTEAKSRGALLAQIQGGVSLRRLSEQNTSEKNKRKTNNSDDDRVTINLNDILDVRNSLKKCDNKSRPYWK